MVADLEDSLEEESLEAALLPQDTDRLRLDLPRADDLADLVFLARELLREPYWALKAEQELGADPSWPIPYGYAVKRRAR